MRPRPPPSLLGVPPSGPRSPAGLSPSTVTVGSDLNLGVWGGHQRSARNKMGAAFSRNSSGSSSLPRRNPEAATSVALNFRAALQGAFVKHLLPCCRREMGEDSPGLGTAVEPRELQTVHLGAWAEVVATVSLTFLPHLIRCKPLISRDPRHLWSLYVFLMDRCLIWLWVLEGW